MTVRGTHRRVRAALLLVLQLTAATAPVADARLGDGAAPTVHIEARSERSCDVQHLHDDCALCRHLAHNPVTCPGANAQPVLAWNGSTVDPARTVRPATVSTLLERGRSPPVV